MDMLAACRPLLMMGLLFTFLLCGCGGTAALESNAVDRDILIDGDEDDWQGALIPIEKKNVKLGVRNNEDYLYVILLTGNRSLSGQIIARGLTLWFDPEGGKEKTFGVRFPLGFRGSGGRGFTPGTTQPPDPEAQRERFEASLREFELLTGDDEGRRFGVDETVGVEVMARIEGGTFIYELKVPLHADASHPYAIGAISGQKIGIGFETPEREGLLRPRGGLPGGGGFGGGRPGGGGVRPGGGIGGGQPGAGGPGRQRPQTPERLDLWTTVRLSETAPSGPAD